MQSDDGSFSIFIFKKICLALCQYNYQNEIGVCIDLITTLIVPYMISYSFFDQNKK